MSKVNPCLMFNAEKCGMETPCNSSDHEQEGCGDFVEDPTPDQIREGKVLGPILRHVENEEPEKYDDVWPILIRLWHLDVR